MWIAEFWEQVPHIILVAKLVSAVVGAALAVARLGRQVRRRKTADRPKTPTNRR